MSLQDFLYAEYMKEAQRPLDMGGYSPARTAPTEIGQIEAARAAAAARPVDTREDLQIAPGSFEPQSIRDFENRVERNKMLAEMLQSRADAVDVPPELPHGDPEKMAYLERHSRRGGAADYYLNQMKEAAEGAEKRKDLSAGERKEMVALGDTLDQVQRLESAIDDIAPELMGGGWWDKQIRDLGTSAGGIFRADEREKAKITLGKLRADVQRAISGAQMTDAEAKRFMEFLPHVDDTYETAVQKIELLKTQLSNQIARREATYGEMGFNVPKVLETMKGQQDPNVIEVDL